MATPTKQTVAKDTILWRVYAVMFIILLIALIMVLQIGHIQFVKGKELREKADSYRVERKKIEAPRGNILAHDGSLLATSLPYYNVYWDPVAIDGETFERYVDTLAVCLANYIDGEMTPGAYSEYLRQARAAGKRFISIRTNVSYLELEHIKTFPIFNMSTKKDTTDPTVIDTLAKQNNQRLLDSLMQVRQDIARKRAFEAESVHRDFVTGLITERVGKRQYPFKHLCRRTLGSAKLSPKIDTTTGKPAKDANGNPVLEPVGVGLEMAYNDVLAGFAGEERMQNIGGGTWVPIEGIEKIEPKAGKDIITNLDVNIQEVAHEALNEALVQYQADNGCAVVMEVATGKIRALVNLGWETKSNAYIENDNYAVRVPIEPGSTFKIASMLALLEDEHVRITDSVYLHYGKASFYGENMEDASAHGLNKTTVAKAFEVSSNVCFGQLVEDHYNKTPEAREQWVRRIQEMYLNKPSGIDLGGEPNPLIHTPGDGVWSGTTPPYMSIGYELLMTPMQLLTFYNAIANGGKMMRPYLVSEIRAYGHTEKKILPEVMNRRIASEESIAQAHQLLKSVVHGSNGTARTIRTMQYNIAGKTGTAITNYKDFAQREVPKKYRASFVGFFPAEKPVYTCIVVITHPKSGFYGGTVAAPVFRKIADYCYMHTVQVHEALNNQPKQLKTAILPDLQIGFAADMKAVVEELRFPYAVKAPNEWVVSRAANDSLFLLPRDVQENIVPNVVGMGLRDALFLLENRRLKVHVIGVGKVKSQSVRPGVNARTVKNITIVLG